MSQTPVKKYLQKRKQELRQKVNEECIEIFDAGFDFIDERVGQSFEEVEPGVNRKIELLEALLFAFLEHAMNLELLDDVDRIIQDVHLGDLKNKVVQ